MPNEIKTEKDALDFLAAYSTEMSDAGNIAEAGKIQIRYANKLLQARQFQQEVTDEEINTKFPTHNYDGVAMSLSAAKNEGAKWMRDRLKPKQQQEDKESKEYFNQAVADTCGELLTSHRELLQRFYNEIRSRFNINDEIAFNSMSEPLATIMKECSKLLSDYEKLK